ncbi:TonB-dependent receptor [Pelomyxa schiedti]|nr:TonB-dependent receptor [Pelomyxa schiedti]
MCDIGSMKVTLYAGKFLGSSVCGYAVDLPDGTMLDAVLCTKEKAKVAFETEAREGKDSSVLQNVSGGNLYNIKIHPFNPGCTRQVSITYICKIDSGSCNLLVEIPLPLSIETMVLKNLELSLTVQGYRNHVPIVSFHGISCNEAMPTFECNSAELDIFRLCSTGHTVTFHDRSSLLSIEIPVPQSYVTEPTVVIGKTSDVDSELFLFLRDPSPPTTATPPTKHPLSIVVLWDSSYSHGCYNKEQEVRLLGELVEALNPIQVLLYFFSRGSCKRAGTFCMSEWGNMKANIEATEYMGGTDFSSITSMDTTSDVDIYLLFSDGFSTMGPTNLPVCRPSIPFFTFSSSPVCNSTVLSALADSTGGQFFPITQNTSCLAIVRVILGLGVAFAGISQHLQHILDDDFPKKTKIPPNGKLEWLAHLPQGLCASLTTITLSFVLPGAMEEVQRTYDVPHEIRSQSLVPQLWAQLKLKNLLLQEELGADVSKEIMSVSKQYNIATSHTSFVILHTVDQFLRHRVEPPLHLSELFTNYHLLLDQNEALRHQKKHNRKLAICEVWARVVQDIMMPHPNPLSKQRHNLLTMKGDSLEDNQLLEPVLIVKSLPSDFEAKFITKSLQRSLSRTLMSIERNQKKTRLKLKKCISEGKMQDATVLAHEILKQRREKVVCLKAQQLLPSVKLDSENAHSLSSLDTSNSEYPTLLFQLLQKFSPSGDVSSPLVVANAMAEHEEEEESVDDLLQQICDEHGLDLSTQCVCGTVQLTSMPAEDDLVQRLRALKEGTVPKAVVKQIEAPKPQLEKPITPDNQRDTTQYGPSWELTKESASFRKHPTPQVVLKGLSTESPKITLGLCPSGIADGTIATPESRGSTTTMKDTEPNTETEIPKHIEGFTGGPFSDDEVKLLTEDAIIIAHGGPRCFSHQYKATIGADFHQCEYKVEDKLGRLQLWEPGGQERFMSLSRIFWRNTDVVLLVYDISNRKTFDNLQHWIEEMVNNCESVGVVLVGNKRDLETNRMVTTEEGNDLARRIGAPFCEISCKQYDTHFALQLLYVQLLSLNLEKFLQVSEASLFKAVIIGDSGVGKTSFAKQLDKSSIDVTNLAKKLSKRMSSFNKREVTSSETGYVPKTILLMGAKGVGKRTLLSLLVRQRPAPGTPLGDTMKFWKYVDQETANSVALLVHLTDHLFSEELQHGMTGVPTSIVAVFDVTRPDTYTHAIHCLGSVSHINCQKILVGNKCDLHSDFTGFQHDSWTLNARMEAWNRSAHYVETSSTKHKAQALEVWRAVAFSVPPAYLSSPQSDATAEEPKESRQSTPPSTASPIISATSSQPANAISLPQRNFKMTYCPPSTTVQPVLHYSSAGDLFDAASAHFSSDPDYAVSILTSALEITFEDAQVMRMVAYKLEEWQHFKEALHLYERILRICPHEPQSHIDLGRILLFHIGDSPRALSCYSVVTDNNTTKGPYDSVWDDNRFEQIEISALFDTWGASSEHSGQCPANPPLLRITLQWNSDKTDLDLVVVLPGGGRCGPFCNWTKSGGGFLTRDFEAYGPENFVLPAVGSPGVYNVVCRVCSSFASEQHGVTAVMRVYWRGQETALRATRITNLSAGSEVQLGSITIDASSP